MVQGRFSLELRKNLFMEKGCSRIRKGFLGEVHIFEVFNRHVEVTLKDISLVMGLIINLRLDDSDCTFQIE